MKPYYEQDGITIYCGDCRVILPQLPKPAVVVTDPPYGISYDTGWRNDNTPWEGQIEGDSDTSVRDAALDLIDQSVPRLVFGSRRRTPPSRTRSVLVWDKGPALGMGALDIPWKPSWEEIYVIGHGWVGTRDEGAVLYCPPVQSMAKNGRVHPNQKPVDLVVRLLAKCPSGAVLDPFAGSGTTLVAAKLSGRPAIGIEINEEYCHVAASRLRQGVLDFGGAA